MNRALKTNKPTRQDTGKCKMEKNEKKKQGKT